MCYGPADYTASERLREFGALDLRHLRHFLILAETLNFHRAAERLHITQPSLSRSIRRLENDIGVELFMRTQRQVQLSAAGRALVPEAQQLLSYAQRTEALLNDLHNGQAGTLRIGFLASTAIALLPKLLREFRQSFPRVHLEMREMSSDAQLQALRDNQIDIGLIRDIGVLPDIHQHLLQREALMLVLPESHPLATKTSIALELLHAEWLILLRREVAPASYDRILAQCRQHALKPRILMELADSNAIFSTVLAGLGLSFLFSTFAEIQRPGIVFRALEDTMGDSEVSIAWLAQNEEDNRIANAFVEIAVSDIKLT